MQGPWRIRFEGRGTVGMMGGRAAGVGESDGRVAEGQRKMSAALDSIKVGDINIS